MTQTLDPESATPSAAPGRPAFESAPASLADRLNLRVLVFVALVLGPVLGLGWVYYSNVASGGIRELPDGYLHVDLQRMSNFVFDQRYGGVDDVPERFRELHGRKVVLDGEMWAPRSASPDVSQFELVYSIADCCYVGEPQVQHFVQSRVVDGGAVRFYNIPVRARGTLRVDVTREEGVVTGVYHLDVEEVRPL